MITMEGITRVYDTGKIQVEALRGIDLTIDEGQFISIMGPSGSGKSTLMHLIGCLDTPTAGKYTLDGEQVETLSDNQLADIRNRKIGFVFQSFNLMPYASAYENVELPLIFAGMSTSKRKERVTELLERVHLADRMDHKPGELSGGQQQRVAIARALVNNPRIILADEPTGNLDSASGEEIMKIFSELWQAGNTIIMITHDPNISDWCNTIVHLKDGCIENGVLHPEDQV
ncbi:MAG: ABC transporter ATP-binding protein [Candidatus Marinimicrobia bacterium]|nr:ABC transporter ATP-binding protein [Candidatus Neomarinimicrobiota bacterium]MCF7828625.1 ABC transporter ATP-binding protein [Candidatus Neomarinimicrobiota bacterium]MCF7880366.1 ABC transporter ATP-binding protein [Candidatus Neomarinimicrobiota bacterium]